MTIQIIAVSTSEGGLKVMKIRLETEVDCPFDVVKSNFGEDLFNYLAPPSFIASSEDYQGDEIGDQIIMKFHFPFPGKWVSEITSREESSNHYQFEDKGVELPLGLSSWHHKHIIEKVDESKTKIIDEMIFSVKNPLLRIPVYIGLYSGFAPRKPKYRSYFKKLKNE